MSTKQRSQVPILFPTSGQSHTFFRNLVPADTQPYQLTFGFVHLSGIEILGYALLLFWIILMGLVGIRLLKGGWQELLNSPLLILLGAGMVAGLLTLGATPDYVYSMLVFSQILIFSFALVTGIRLLMNQDYIFRQSKAPHIAFRGTIMSVSLLALAIFGLITVFWLGQGVLGTILVGMLWVLTEWNLWWYRTKILEESESPSPELPKLEFPYA